VHDRTAFVAGATGLIGKSLTRLLCERAEYRNVRIAVRRTIDYYHPKLTQEILNFDRMEKFLDLKGVTDVFCTLGTTIGKAGSREVFHRVDFEYPLSLSRCAARDRVRRILLVSSAGANPKSGNFYLRTKGEVEVGLVSVFSGPIHLFRPSLLLGKRSEFRFGERIGGALMTLMSFMMVGRLRNYRPIKASDVALGMIAAALSESEEAQKYESGRIQELADTISAKISEQ